MKDKNYWPKLLKKNSVLTPVDRISEVLFGLIMVLTFTGAISVSQDGHEEISSLLWAALGCNVAWGIVDAIMYLMNVTFERGYSRKVFNEIKHARSGADAIGILRDEIQPAISDLMSDEEIGKLGKKISLLPQPPAGLLLTLSDYAAGLKIFILVFICTLPVALPFGFIEDPATALHVSNGIALLMLFIGGYKLATHAGFRPVITGLVYMLIGVVLVALTIALGG